MERAEDTFLIRYKVVRAIFSSILGKRSKHAEAF